jgi:hypothetical protein
MLLNKEIEPAQSLEKGAGKSLNIKTGAQQWQQQTNASNNNNSQQQQQPAAHLHQQRRFQLGHGRGASHNLAHYDLPRFRAR